MAVDANELRTEMAGLDALETEDHAEAVRPPGRVAAGVAEAGRARIIVLGLWQLVVASHWRPDYVLPGPKAVGTELLGNGQDAVGSGTRSLRTDEARRRRLSRSRCSSAVWSARLVATVKPLRSAVGVADHRPADDAVDRVVPARRAAVQAERDRRSCSSSCMGAAPAIANGLISGVDHVPPLLVRAGRVLGAKKLHAVPPRDPPGRVAVVPRRPEAGVGVRVAQPHGGRTAAPYRSARRSAPTCRPARDLNDAEGPVRHDDRAAGHRACSSTPAFGAADNALRRRWGLVDPAT